MRHVLVIDLGTSGPKVALVSEDGRLAATAARTVRTLRIGTQGAEQDARELWRSVAEATREVTGRAALPAESIVGVRAISQYSSIVPVDAKGNPTSNLVLWMDGRGGAHSMALYGEHPMAIPTWVEHHGVVPLPSGADSLSHMLHVKNDRPDVYEQTSCFLEAMDYLNLRFTGTATANVGSAFMMLLTDNRSPQLLEWDAELIAMSGIDPGKLPKLVPVRGPVGSLLPTVADELGLPAGIPVFASMNDTQAASIGTGTFLEDRGAVNVGTTCQLLSHMDRKDTDMEAQLVSMPSPLPGRFLVVAENGLGGGAIKHFLESIIFAKDALGDTTSADPYAGIDQALSETRAGAGGVLFLPWLNGAQFPAADPDMRGGFLNVSLDTTRADLLRAVIEGVTFNLRGMLGPVEKFTGRSFDHLSFSGGGARSEGFAQIVADMMKRPVLQLNDARFVNNLAGAFLAFEELGVQSLDAIRTFVSARKEFKPRPEASETYDRLAAQFDKSFGAVQPICSALQS